MRLHSHRSGSTADPLVSVTRQTLGMWAQSIWEQYPAPRIMKVVLEQAMKKLQAVDKSWRLVATPGGA